MRDYCGAWLVFLCIVCIGSRMGAWATPTWRVRGVAGNQVRTRLRQAVAIFESLISGCAMLSLQILHTLFQMRLYLCGTYFAPVVSIILY